MNDEWSCLRSHLSHLCRSKSYQHQVDQRVATAPTFGTFNYGTFSTAAAVIVLGLMPRVEPPTSVAGLDKRLC